MQTWICQIFHEREESKTKSHTGLTHMAFLLIIKPGSRLYQVSRAGKKTYSA